MRSLLRSVLAVTALALLPTPVFAAEGVKAGAFAQDISPTKFPSPVNGNLKGAFTSTINDPMHARCLAVADGKKEVIFCVVDSCMIPREICEKAKTIASAKTGVPASQLLISATHTHTAATMAAVFQSDPDPEYVAGLPERIAAGIAQAHANLEPAEIGWGKSPDPDDVFNRRWFVVEPETVPNPFGEQIDRAIMNPGYKNPKTTKPAGPVDPDVSLLVARAVGDHRPIGLLANYSLHYVGGLPAISADYFAAFADEMGRQLKAGDERYAGKPAFVGIMSNGTSGNINNVNFALPRPGKREPGEQIRKVAASVAEAAMKAYDGIAFHPQLTVDAVEADLALKVRKPKPEEIERAQKILTETKKDPDGMYAARDAIYARETVLIAEYPDEVPVKLQVQRIGDLSVASIPCEVFAEIGLELKARSPFAQHFTISLANGYNGYLPTAEHHALGGYETWRARSSYLEVPAAEKITARLIELLTALKTRQ